MLPLNLVTEETIATLFDHHETAANNARLLLDTNTDLAEPERQLLFQIVDGWAYCSRVLLNGQRPHRDR